MKEISRNLFLSKSQFNDSIYSNKSANPLTQKQQHDFQMQNISCDLETTSDNGVNSISIGDHKKKALKTL